MAVIPEGHAVESQHAVKFPPLSLEVFFVPDVAHWIHDVLDKGQYTVPVAISILFFVECREKPMSLRHLRNGIREATLPQVSSDLRPGQSSIRVTQDIANRFQVRLINFRDGGHRLSISLYRHSHQRDFRRTLRVRASWDDAAQPFQSALALCEVENKLKLVFAVYALPPTIGPKR